MWLKCNYLWSECFCIWPCTGYCYTESGFSSVGPRSLCSSPWMAKQECLCQIFILVVEGGKYEGDHRSCNGSVGRLRKTNYRVPVH